MAQSAVITRAVGATGALEARKFSPGVVPTPREIASEIDKVCLENDAQFWRRPLDDGNVQVSLHFLNGDTISATAATTAEAWDGLVTRLSAFQKHLGEGAQ